jgi:hypothetical protein
MYLFQNDLYFGCFDCNLILDIALALCFKKFSVCSISEINRQILARGGAFRDRVTYGPVS